MYLGLPPLMKAPAGQGAGLHASWWSSSRWCWAFVPRDRDAWRVGLAGVHGWRHARRPDRWKYEYAGRGNSVNPNSVLGKLETFGNKMEESAKKMEAAEKSGDTDAQINAALEGLGTLFGGGKRVDPVGDRRAQAIRARHICAAFPRRAAAPKRPG